MDEESFRDDESIRDDDASLAADDDEGSEAVADEASEVGGSAFSDEESEEPQSGGGDEGAAEGLAPVDNTGVKLKAGTCDGDAPTLSPTILVFAPAVLDKALLQALHDVVVEWDAA